MTDAYILLEFSGLFSLDLVETVLNLLSGILFYGLSHDCVYGPPRVFIRILWNSLSLAGLCGDFMYILL